MNLIVASLTFWHTIPYNKMVSSCKPYKRFCPIYVNIPGKLGSDEPFEEKMGRLTAKLDAQFAESVRLEKAIRENLQRLSDEH